jgi:predicted RND superfamily exporter protein
MEAARTSETSVDIQLRTRQYIPEDSELNVSFNQLNFRFQGNKQTTDRTEKLSMERANNLLILMICIAYRLTQV